MATQTSADDLTVLSECLADLAGIPWYETLGHSLNWLQCRQMLGTVPHAESCAIISEAYGNVPPGEIDWPQGTGGITVRRLYTVAQMCHTKEPLAQTTKYRVDHS